MRIVYYIDQLYLHGGIEKILSLKLNYLVKLPDYQVYLITSEQKENAFCYIIDTKVKHIDLGINYNRKKSYLSFENLLKVPKLTFLLKKELKTINPDVVVVCNYAFDFYLIPFITKKIKTIREFHGSRYNHSKMVKNASVFGKVIYKFNEFIEKKYSHIVVLNKDEEQHFKGTNIVVIPNGIGIEINKNTVTRKNCIIAAGRIAPVKQFDHLIEAWSIIAKKHPKWEVHIYGEGESLLINKLNKLINKLELTTIKFMGATNNLNDKMKAASIFALTSETECFPMVLLESLACGLPIVSYNCPYGPSNIITDTQDGILVEANNKKKFATALSNLIEDKEKRSKMEKAAITNIVRFNDNKVMQKWLQLFNKKM